MSIVVSLVHHVCLVQAGYAGHPVPPVQARVVVCVLIYFLACVCFLNLTQELSQGHVPTPGLVPTPKSQGIPAWKPGEQEVAPDGVAPDADMKADGEPRTKRKWNDDEWKRWQEKKDASKAASKAKSDEGQWKKASWGKAQWKSYAPTVPVASEASKPPQGSMTSNPILPDDPLWQSIGDLRQQHVAVHQELSEVQVKIQTLTEEQTKVNSESSDAMIKLGGDIAGVNERLAQHQALRTLEKEDVTKLSKFMEEQRDKCKVMDEQLGVAMAKDKEESERHRSRLDELCARCAAQDDRIKVLEAKLAIPSDSSDMKKAMEKK